ncbi:outer membrane beta-barrel protein [Chryseolinea sp. T2]|uniref:outer membrane beta-barrel protein n=1 Tax=Chryseolinea sp. T2 TaxID=3129255 RepID=UPI0030769172
MKYLYAILLCSIGHSALAQSYASAQYSINFPMGNTADFISKPSFRGLTFDYRYEVTPRILVGVSAGWYTFYNEAGYDSYTSKDESITASGQQFRYMNSVPLLVMADYYFSEADLKPFVGVGLGTTYNRVDLEMGMYTWRADPWQFSVAPEAGLAYKIAEGTSALVSVRYNMSFSSRDLDSQSFLGLNLGLVTSLGR